MFSNLCDLMKWNWSDGKNTFINRRTLDAKIVMMIIKH